jgi:hypothetical protein
MNSALVIFNGIKFPYYLMEYSLARAKQQESSLHVLFLKAGKEITEGYGFPSDLKATEKKTAIEESEDDDLRIINHHMKLAIDMAASENVNCTTELITDCSLEKISTLIKNYDEIYVDSAYDDENTSMLGNNKFTLTNLIEQAPSKIKQVSEDFISEK